VRSTLEDVRSMEGLDAIGTSSAWVEEFIADHSDACSNLLACREGSMHCLVAGALRWDNMKKKLLIGPTLRLKSFYEMRLINRDAIDRVCAARDLQPDDYLAVLLRAAGKKHSDQSPSGLPTVDSV